MSSTATGVPGQILFGVWRFNASTGDLTDGKTNTHLEPQVAKLLEYFLIHQNTLFSRDKLMAAVWGNRIVSDDAINRCISILRQILTPDDRNAYIETLVRRGFLSHFPPAPDREPPVKKPSRRRIYAILLVLSGVFAVTLYSYSVTFTQFPPLLRDAQGDGPPMVAVLPFTSTGMDNDSEFFANGMHDDLLTQLAQLQSLRAISRTSVLEFQDTERNLRDIGWELGADAVLEGGIQRIGDQIRINVQLIDARTDTHLWAAQYDRELLPANIFAVQSEIARAIANELQASLTAQDEAQLRVLPTQNMAAYRAYHRALEIRDELDVDQPAYIQSLEEAVTLDPSFTRAWAELAGYLSFRNSSQDPESIQRVERILENIRAIAPDSADYLIAQAFYTYYVLRNYDQAYQLITKAQGLRPGDERLLELKSNIQRRQGNFEGKIESMRMARTLDPRNRIWTASIANNLIITHQYDQARRELEEYVNQNSDMAVLYSALQMQEHQDAARWVEELSAIQKEFAETTIPVDMWESRIATRDYATAEKLVAQLQTSGNHGYRFSMAEMSGVDLYQLITYFFMQKSEKLEPFLAQVKSFLDAPREPGSTFRPDMQVIVKAFVAAAEGNTEETERLIRVWSRTTSDDPANKAISRHFACRALGMASATTAAVDCIRTALVEPSYVMPFMEPFLPYYDSIRDEPEFIALLNEI